MSDIQPTVTVAGEVERPLAVDLHDLADLPGEEVTVDFHCHEGWSRLGEDVDRIELTRTEQRATGPSIALARIGR